MKKVYIVSININKLFKRNINNEYLKKALGDLTELNLDKFKYDKDITKALEKIEDIEAYNTIKETPVIYEDILKNLEESEKILDNVKDNLNIAKENSLNITLELKDNVKNIKDIKIEGLNKELKNTRDINTNNEIILDNEKIIIDKTDIYKEKILNVKKSMFDIE